MKSTTARLPLATKIINAGLVVLGAAAAVGAAVPLWPLISWKYMGRPSPTENFVLAVFGYPATQGGWLWHRDLPLDIRTITMLPVVIQTLAIIAIVVLVVRLFSAISRGAAFHTRALRSLTALSVVGIGGGLLQFAVGVVAWQVGHEWLNPSPSLDPYQVALFDQFPFPQWPLTLILVGILATALRVAFRAGARFERELEGVV